MATRKRKPSTALASGLSNLEKAVGGRKRLVSTLLEAPLSKEQRAVLGILADPGNDKLHLLDICRTNRISYQALIRLFQDATWAKAHVDAVARAAEKLPAVAESVMDRGVVHDVPCPICFGRGAEGCSACDGKGTILRAPDTRSQELALQLGGLVSRGGAGVNVSVNQQTTVQQAQGEFHQDFATFQTDSDAALFPVIDVKANE